MEKTIQILKFLFAIICGYTATILGGFDNLVVLLLVLTACDLLFGSAKGIKNKNFSSSIFLWGLVNKAIVFMVIAIMVKIDLVLGKAGMLRNVFIIWFSLCEGASIIENSAALGIPWPDGLLGVLVQVRKGFSINICKIVEQIIDNYNVARDTEGGNK